MDRIIQLKHPLAELKNNIATITTTTNLPKFTISQVNINKKN